MLSFCAYYRGKNNDDIGLDVYGKGMRSWFHVAAQTRDVTAKAAVSRWRFMRDVSKGVNSKMFHEMVQNVSPNARSTWEPQPGRVS